MKQVGPLEIGLPVMDLDRMLEFYAKVFACKELGHADLVSNRALAEQGEGVKLALLRDPKGNVFEFVQTPNL